MTSSTQDTPGLDLDALAPWLASHVEDVGPSLSATLIAGGKSNLTFAVCDGSREWIVRRPPLGHVLATAHDMGREYRVMSALQDTAVPVPRTFAHCADTDVIGAEFYVMERVGGIPYRSADQLEALGEDRVRTIATRLVDTMTSLHAVVPASVGLDDFGRPEGFLARQVGRWRKQLDASHSRDLPAAQQLHAQLAAKVPPGSASGIVHGDFRLDNVLFDTAGGDDRATAVLDWEMATLGDPLTDLALMITYHRLDALRGRSEDAVSTAAGFLTETEVIERYAATSDRDLSDVGWYLGLAAFKLATILEGVHYRYLQGQTVGPGFDQVGVLVEPLLDAGLTAMKEN